jgi:hypothetical protein
MGQALHYKRSWQWQPVIPAAMVKALAYGIIRAKFMQSAREDTA